MDLHTQASANAKELDELRTSLASLQKRSRDISLVTASGGQDIRDQLEAVRALVADLNSKREFAETDSRRLRATAGQTVSSIRNLYTRVVWTAPPTALPSVIVNGKSIPPPVYVPPGGSSKTAKAGKGERKTDGGGKEATAVGASESKEGKEGDIVAGGGSMTDSMMSEGQLRAGESMTQGGNGVGPEGSTGGGPLAGLAELLAGTGVPVPAGALAAAGQTGAPGTTSGARATAGGTAAAAAKPPRGAAGKKGAQGGASGDDSKGGEPTDILTSMMTAPDLASYLGQCLQIIGDRITDLVAITGEYQAWKENGGGNANQNAAKEGNAPTAAGPGSTLKKQGSGMLGADGTLMMSSMGGDGMNASLSQQHSSSLLMASSSASLPQDGAPPAGPEGGASEKKPAKGTGLRVTAASLGAAQAGATAAAQAIGQQPGPGQAGSGGAGGGGGITAGQVTFIPGTAFIAGQDSGLYMPSFQRANKLAAVPQPQAPTLGGNASTSAAAGGGGGNKGGK
jgi:hypothetical protein